jgi:nucleolar GTP-binding protein
LDNPEWKNDVWPEFMDGKNVFDYVDPDILQKLERLEQEEEDIRNQMESEPLDSDEESSELSEDLLEAHEELVENKKTIKRKHQLVVGNQLPRKVRDLTASEKFMEEIRTDKKEGLAELKSLSQKKRRETKERLKRSLINEAKDIEEDDEEENDDMMDIDMEEEGVKQPKKKKRLEDISEEAKLKEKCEKQKQLVVERMKRKIQKKWSNQIRVNDADRQIGNVLPKHLNSGKRGIGKNQRR